MADGEQTASWDEVIEVAIRRKLKPSLGGVVVIAPFIYGGVGKYDPTIDTLSTINLSTINLSTLQNTTPKRKKDET